PGPVTTRVPAPVLVNPCGAARVAARVTEMFALLTAIVGSPLLLRLRVLLPMIDQPKVFVGLSNTRPPMVRLVSSVTLTGPVRPATATAAVLLAPSATMPPDQFVAVLQLYVPPPLLV